MGQAKGNFETGAEEDPEALGHSSNYNKWLGLVLKLARTILHWAIDPDYWSNRGEFEQVGDLELTEDQIDRIDDLSDQLAFFFDCLAVILKFIVATRPPPNGSEQDLANYYKANEIASTVKAVIERAYEVAESQEGFDSETFVELWKFLGDFTVSAMTPANL